jgi:hypothetical protein
MEDRALAYVRASAEPDSSLSGHTHSSSDEKHAADVPENLDTISWEVIYYFCEIEWFTRVWVQQELGQSQRAVFHWGGSFINGEHVATYVS